MGQQLGRKSADITYGKKFVRNAVKAKAKEPQFFHMEAIVKTNGLTEEQCEQILSDVTKRIRGGEIAKFEAKKLYSHNKLLKGLV